MPSCKTTVIGVALLCLSAIIGVVTWRYGPWNASHTEPSSSSSSSMSTSKLLSNSTCSTCCNGLPSNCNLTVNNLLFPGVHNAHSSYEDNFLAASNNLPFEDALVAGYRALHLESCLCEGGALSSQFLLEQDPAWGLQDSNLGFCHGLCGAGVRDPKQVLSSIASFLEYNAQEVVIVIFQVNEGSFSDLRTAIRSSGLQSYLYVSSDKYIQWPTMQSLIDANTRLLLFAYGDSLTSCYAPDCTDGILYAPDHLGYTAEGDIDTCEPTLTGDNNVGFFMMNQYKYTTIPLSSEGAARDLNSKSVLETRLEKCKGRQLPSLLMVEFWEVGEVLELVTEENKRRGGVKENTNSMTTNATVGSNATAALSEVRNEGSNVTN